MDDDVKRKLILFFGVICVGVVFYIIFVAGASYSCSSGGGILAKDMDGMRCLDLEHTDLCRDYNGKIIKKPESVFRVDFNNSDYKFNFTG